jgi:hypothetical protein
MAYCQTAVPKGEAHRLPKKVRVSIGVVGRSQGQKSRWQQQNRSRPKHLAHLLRAQA